MLGSLVLLLAALAADRASTARAGGSTLGGVTFQPSELAKLAVAIWAALYLSRRPAPRTLGELANPIGCSSPVFCALVLAEPDLGTAIAICLMVGAI